MWDKLKNAANNMVMDASKYIYTPPEQDQFTVNGQLSPEEFKKAGDHLVSVIVRFNADMSKLVLEAILQSQL